MKNKRGMSAWIWIVIVLIVLGIGAYFLLSGDGGGSIFGGGIPQPPALPD